MLIQFIRFLKFIYFEIDLKLSKYYIFNIIR